MLETTARRIAVNTVRLPGAVAQADQKCVVVFLYGFSVRSAYRIVVAHNAPQKRAPASSPGLKVVPLMVAPSAHTWRLPDAWEDRRERSARVHCIPRFAPAFSRSRLNHSVACQPASKVHAMSRRSRIPKP